MTMAQHMFGCGRGRINNKIATRANEVARRHGAVLNNINNPGQGWIYWFAGPNRGDPFDRAMANAVRDDLEREGIELP